MRPLNVFTFKTHFPSQILIISKTMIHLITITETKGKIICYNQHFYI